MIHIEILGNVESLKESVLNEIEALYDFEIAREEFLPPELVRRLSELTGRINREIAVFIHRKGTVVSVSIGDSGTVSLPEVEGRRSRTRLSAIRCIHTHPGGEGKLSSVDINSLLHLRLDAMVAVGVREGKPTEVYAAVPITGQDCSFEKADVFGPFEPDDIRLDGLIGVIAERDRMCTGSAPSNESDVERAIVVGLETTQGREIDGKGEGQRSLDELEELAQTAGVTVVDRVLQKKTVQDAAFYIGRGKVEQLALLRQAVDADVIIFDDELSGAQIRNLEDATGAKVVDRTTLILDIFAQRARSSEGKLQVELAQLKYRLPRLVGLGGQLSRLGGGIGTRGPGEKKLEVDRRHIRRRISFLEDELEKVGKRRGLTRAGRNKRGVPAMAVVGYTNAGKSTLVNKLCSADIFAENKLFATLDPTARKLLLPDGREMLLVDTVGFIRKLPHDLVEAFKSTLEEAVHADALLHVVDASDPEAEEHIRVSYDILRSLGATNKTIVTVYNKMDLAGPDFRPPIRGSRDIVCEVSAATGQGLDKLLEIIQEIFRSDEIEVGILAPYDAGWVPAYVRENGKVLEEEYGSDGARIRAVLKKDRIARVMQFIKNS